MRPILKKNQGFLREGTPQVTPNHPPKNWAPVLCNPKKAPVIERMHSGHIMYALSTYNGHVEKYFNFILSPLAAL